MECRPCADDADVYVVEIGAFGSNLTTSGAGSRSLLLEGHRSNCKEGSREAGVLTAVSYIMLDEFVSKILPLIFYEQSQPTNLKLLP